jgi:hypothetical protein
VKLVLDSGALIALERNDRAMWRRLRAARLAGYELVTHGGVVGQAWRGKSPRQALLAKALDGINVRPLDRALGIAAGELLALAKRSDVVDAALVLLAEDEDHIATSDPDDIEPLAARSGRDVELILV